MSETTTDIWDIQTGAMVKRLPLGNASLAFSPDGSVLAVLAGLELDPGNPFSSQPGDGYLLLGQLRQFNTLTGAEIPSSSPPVSEIAFSPKGELVLVTREGIQAYSIRPSLIPNTKACHSVVFDGEGDLVALCPKGLMKVVLATGTVKPLTLPKSVDTAGIVQVNVQTERTPRELFVGISPPGAVTAFDVVDRLAEFGFQLACSHSAFWRPCVANSSLGARVARCGHGGTMASLVSVVTKTAPFLYPMCRLVPRPCTQRRHATERGGTPWNEL
jgi:hypothetical protein